MQPREFGVNLILLSVIEGSTYHSSPWVYLLVVSFPILRLLPMRNVDTSPWLFVALALKNKVPSARTYFDGVRLKRVIGNLEVIRGRSSGTWDESRDRRISAWIRE